jgi:hypothetical protein
MAEEQLRLHMASDQDPNVSQVDKESHNRSRPRPKQWISMWTLVIMASR